MLFDHLKDPGENVNIAGHPEKLINVKQLSNQLEEFKAASSFRRRDTGE